MPGEKLVLKFPPRVVREPIMYHLVKDYNLRVNIVRAAINTDEAGQMVMELDGARKQLEEGRKYLERLGITVAPLSKDVRWREDRCVHCTACVSACPTGALKVERPSMRVSFHSQKCIACELCIPVCSYKAMEIQF